MGNINLPMREKYWKEKSTEEKLNVVADLLAEAHREIHNLTSRIDDMLLHVHHPYTGHPMIPPRDPPEFSRYPPGYCREDFLLGRAPPEQYGRTPVQGAGGWAGEAQIEGSLPTAPRDPAPATGPENAPEQGPRLGDWPLKGEPTS